MTRDAAPSTKKARQVAGTYLWNKFVATLRYRKGKGHILLEVRKRGGSGAAWSFPQEVSLTSLLNSSERKVGEKCQATTLPEQNCCPCSIPSGSCDSVRTPHLSERMRDEESVW